MRELSNDFSNPNLFMENKAGEYQYGTNSSGGRFACGSLKLTDNVVRDGQAQVKAGGISRRMRGHNWGSDDGGHLIGARFGGTSGEENLVAQNSNYNRSDYKRMESRWAKHLEKGDKVFVYIDTDALERPNAFMGYAIYESSNGERTMETFHHANESRSENSKWEDEYDEFIRENPGWDAGFDEEASVPENVLEEGLPDLSELTVFDDSNKMAADDTEPEILTDGITAEDIPAFDPTDPLNAKINEIVNSDLSPEHKKVLLEDMKQTLQNSVSGSSATQNEWDALNDDTDDGVAVKVLKRGGGSTSIVHRDYEQELSDLETGITNAWAPYQAVVDSIGADTSLTDEEKLQKFNDIQAMWEQESAPWYAEHAELSQKINQTSANEFDENYAMNDGVGVIMPETQSETSDVGESIAVDSVDKVTDAKPPILKESKTQSRKDDYLGTVSENKNEIETETTEEKTTGRSSKMESSADNYLGEAAQMETTNKVSSIESGRSISGGASSSSASSSNSSSNSM